jgi:hypothetical protein
MVASCWFYEIYITMHGSINIKFTKTITLNGISSKRLVYQHINAGTVLSQCMQLENYILIKPTLSFRFITNTNNFQVYCILYCILVTAAAVYNCCTLLDTLTFWHTSFTFKF